MSCVHVWFIVYHASIDHYRGGGLREQMQIFFSQAQSIQNHIDCRLGLREPKKRTQREHRTKKLSPPNKQCVAAEGRVGTEKKT